MWKNVQITAPYCTCKNVHILPLAEHARKFVPRMLSMQSAYAQHAIKSFPRMLRICMLQISKMTQKTLIKMQISPIKNPNFEKPSRNLSNRTKGKKKFWISFKKILFRVCSVTAEMFEHRNSDEKRRKRSEIFFENLRRAYKDLI